MSEVPAHRRMSDDHSSSIDNFIEDLIAGHPDWSDEQVAADFDEGWRVDAARVAEVRSRL